MPILTPNLLDDRGRSTGQFKILKDEGSPGLPLSFTSSSSLHYLNLFICVFILCCIIK